MSLYGEYIAEREGFEIVEYPQGFLTYSTGGSECYIRDLYVRPDFRKTHLASQMADKVAEIAKSRGCTHLVGTVVPSANGSTVSMKVLLAYGFEIVKSEVNMIYLAKRIQ